MESPLAYVDDLVHSAIFARFLCSFGPPSRAPEAYHLERVGTPLHDAVDVICEKGAFIENQGAGALYNDGHLCFDDVSAMCLSI